MHYSYIFNYIMIMFHISTIVSVADVVVDDLAASTWEKYVENSVV